MYLYEELLIKAGEGELNLIEKDFIYGNKFGLTNELMETRIYESMNAYAIYRLKDPNSKLKNLSIYELKENNLKIKKGNYELIYSNILSEDCCEDDVLEKFSDNLELPVEFNNTPLENGDIIVLRDFGQIYEFYISEDSLYGIPGFFYDKTRELLLPLKKEIDTRDFNNDKMSILLSLGNKYICVNKKNNKYEYRIINEAWQTLYYNVINSEGIYSLYNIVYKALSLIVNPARDNFFKAYDNLNGNTKKCNKIICTFS